MTIPHELKKGPRRDVILSIRVTKKDMEFLNKHDISPTRLLNWGIHKMRTRLELDRDRPEPIKGEIEEVKDPPQSLKK